MSAVLRSRLPQVDAARAAVLNRLLPRLAQAAGSARVATAVDRSPQPPWPTWPLWLRCRLDPRTPSTANGSLDKVRSRSDDATTDRAVGAAPIDVWLGLRVASAADPGVDRHGAVDPIDHVAAAHALADVEPLIIRLEAALGADLTPLSPQLPPTDVAAFGVGAEDRLGFAIKVDTAARLDLPPTAAATTTVPSALAGVLVDLRLRFNGPNLSARRVAALAVGDCVLIVVTNGAPARIAAVIAVAGHELAGGHFLPVSRGFETGRLLGAFMDSADRLVVSTDHSAPQSASPTPPAAVNWAELPVSLSFELTGAGVRLADLAALQPGAVLELAGDTADRLPLRVLAGHTHVADGELVALGAGYGVRIDRLLPR